MSYRESFLCTGMMSTNLRIEGKVDELIDLLNIIFNIDVFIPNIKVEKKSAFCFEVFVVNWDEWDVLLISKHFILFPMSARDTVLKEN